MCMTHVELVLCELCGCKFNHFFVFTFYERKVKGAFIRIVTSYQVMARS